MMVMMIIVKIIIIIRYVSLSFFSLFYLCFSLTLLLSFSLLLTVSSLSSRSCSLSLCFLSLIISPSLSVQGSAGGRFGPLDRHRRSGQRSLLLRGVEQDRPIECFHLRNGEYESGRLFRVRRSVSSLTPPLPLPPLSPAGFPVPSVRLDP